MDPTTGDEKGFVLGTMARDSDRADAAIGDDVEFTAASNPRALPPAVGPEDATAVPGDATEGGDSSDCEDDPLENGGILRDPGALLG